jgi:hypothetical protein
MFVLVTIASGATLPAEPPVLTNVLCRNVGAISLSWFNVSNTVAISMYVCARITKHSIE